MTPIRLASILFIYVCSAVVWSVLGGTLVSRTGESDAQLKQEVAQLWGGRHLQVAPTAFVERPRTVVEEVRPRDGEHGPATRVEKTVMDAVPIGLGASRVQVSLDLDQRKKGLLWYDTYGVVFQARYRVKNPDDVPRRTLVHFAYPSAEAMYDGFVFRFNGHPAEPGLDLAQGLQAEAQLGPGQEAEVEVAYRSRGLGDWSYAFVDKGVAQVKDFELNLATDFAAIDFPAGTLSPTHKQPTAQGWQLTWRFESLAAGQHIGVDAPNRLNPGPVAARITFFAPVGLLFFLTVMVIIGIMKGRSLHPMNYFFLAAAFFAFHLLLAYLVDHLDIHASFAIAAAVSLFLVVSYLRVVAGMRTALVEAGLAQLVFLVLFSYAFFFEGYTGLAITVGAVLTLFVLMQVTARVDWPQVFARGRAELQAGG